jgi:rhodanese-related sulfurtransferase
MFLFNRGQTQTEASYKNLTTDDYQAQYFNGKQAHTLVDVRTTEEYRSGHIPGAVNIPLNTLPARLKEIPADRPVVVVCATGNRSRSGASAFVRGGYAEVYNLQGGTMRWMMQRWPIKA